MSAPTVVALLKQDAFGRVELLEHGTRHAVRRVACGGRLPMSRNIARLLLARERRALAALAGLDEPSPTGRARNVRHSRDR